MPLNLRVQMDTPFFLCLALAVVSALAYRYFTPSSQTISFPPGPPPDPFIGNVRQIPRTSAWKTYVEWSKTYNSDIISFKTIGKRMVVLNSARAVTDLFEKRGSIYSGRNRNVILQDIIGMKNMVFMQYNDLFRLHRKIINIALNPTAIRNYYPLQEKEAYALVLRCLENPDKWNAHLRRAANSTILTMAYGHEVTTDDDYLVSLSERTTDMIRQAFAPTAFVVNMVPALRNVPDWLLGSRFRRFIRDGKRLCTELQERPFKEVKDQMASGVVPPSYTARLLEAKGSISEDPDVDEEEVVKTTAVVMYAAGSDSSTASVTTVILALVLHPDVQRKAQAEIDAVIGNNRLPTIVDQTSLPYLEMVLSESMRWNPVSSLGIPHAVQQDDVYNGMFIPKGTVVISNIWALLHDETMYPEPHKFWPERFDGRFPQARHPRSYAFGFNRRLCPGRHFALTSLFIQVSTLLAVFNFSKARDENGNEIEPLVDYSEGLPKPFKCTIKPRSDEAAALIRSAVAATAV